jgi:hypothetical protein
MTYMRNYVLTETEKKIVHRFLETSNHLEGYRMLKARMLKLDVDELQNQIDLIKAFKNKIKE